MKREGSRAIANLHRHKVTGLFGPLLFDLRVQNKFRDKADVFRVNRFFIKTLLVHTCMDRKTSIFFNKQHDLSFCPDFFMEGQKNKIK